MRGGRMRTLPQGPSVSSLWGHEQCEGKCRAAGFSSKHCDPAPPSRQSQPAVAGEPRDPSAQPVNYHAPAVARGRARASRGASRGAGSASACIRARLRVENAGFVAPRREAVLAPAPGAPESPPPPPGALPGAGGRPQERVDQGPPAPVQAPAAGGGGRLALRRQVASPSKRPQAPGHATSFGAPPSDVPPNASAKI